MLRLLPPLLQPIYFRFEQKKMRNSKRKVTFIEDPNEQFDSDSNDDPTYEPVDEKL